jgi:hypothetical protein
VNAAIIALEIASAVSVAMLAYAALFGWRILRHWDLASSSELQVSLERHTYLVSTLVAFVLAIEAVSLLLFVYNADRMAPQFVGAMCAVGTLNTSGYGFPALFLKILVFFSASTWLIVHRLDTRGYDYPLTRTKYALLFGIAPLVLVEAYLQTRFFLAMDTDVITSCCGTLFGADREAVAADLASLAPGPTMVAFYAVMGLTLVVGLAARRWPGMTGAYSLLSAVAFLTTVVAVVSFVSLYVYEHPHHHCPFCLLKAEYGYTGYLLYVPLFFGTVLGLGAGAVRRFAGVASLATVVPGLTRRLVGGSLALLVVSTLWVTYLVAGSGLMLLGNEGV